MHKNLLFISFIFIQISTFCQGNSIECGNGRYVSNIFTNVTKTVGVTFGHNSVPNYATSTSTDKTLKFDFYEPAGDVAAKRPLIILLFGGGFVTGQRSDMDPFCMAFAKKGYAVATIDYRLIDTDPLNQFFLFLNQTYISDAVIKASGDLKAAIRYFKRDAASTNIYKIDTSKIILGGISAGAITALQTAYTDDVNEDPLLTSFYNSNGGLEGNTDLPSPGNLLPSYNSRGAIAVINIAGGISDTSLIDSFNPAIYSSQGTADELVPFNFGPITINGTPTSINLYGSNLITTRANNVGLKNQFLPIPLGNHESPGTEPYVSQIITDATTFLESIICGGSLPVTLTSFTVSNNNCTGILHWKTATEQQSSHYDIESSVDGVRFTKVASVPSKNATGGADYFYSLNGSTQQALFRLKMTDKDGRVTYSGIQQYNPACAPAISIYPNPATAFATINGLQAGMRVRLMNTDGMVLFTQRASGNLLQIPLAKFANGLLMVQVIDEKGTLIRTSKLLKN